MDHCRYHVIVWIVCLSIRRPVLTYSKHSAAELVGGGGKMDQTKPLSLGLFPVPDLLAHEKIIFKSRELSLAS